MKKLFPALFVFVSACAFGQTNAELNGLITQSLAYFPKVQEMAANEEISALRIDIAKSNYLPSINGTGIYNYVNPVGQVQFPISATETKLLQFQPHNNYNFNVGLNQVIWDFGKTKAQVEKSKNDLLTAHANTESARLQVAAQVASIYYGMIFLRKSIEVQDSVIAYYASNQKIVEGKIRQGDALQIDLSTIAGNIDQEKNRKVEFERQYARQAALLKYTTGQNGEPVQNSLEFNFASGQTDLSSNPDLQAAKLRILSSSWDARLAAGNKLPSLSFQANAGYKNGYQPDIQELRFNVLAGATLSIPIYQGARLRKNEAIAQKTLALSTISGNTMLATLTKDLESVQADIKAYDQQIKNSEGQITVAKETSRLTQVRYRQGAATYLDLVSASTNLQRANLSRIQYEYQRTLSLIENCRLTGTKFWQ